MRTNISGFPEYTPSEQLAFDAITAKIRHVYQSFGYVPLETAAVERIETLTSKGIDSKEVYALRRLNAQGDDGDKDIALRFDLTVPLARYVAQNYSSLTFPYRRYQCQPVWRGERPQFGRYRQFHQFDLDVIADGKLDLAADAEVIAAAHTAIKTILPASARFFMRINNRKLLQGLIEYAGYSSDDEIYKVIKVIDNLEKTTPENSINELKKINTSANAEELYTLVKSKNGLLDIQHIDHVKVKDGFNELSNVCQTITSLLGSTSNIAPDFSIARGLDYYTGTVVETTLHAAPELGSICSGGRYDNLTASLSDRNLPGVGVSIGISRLAAWLMEQAPYNAMPATTAQVIVTGPNAAAACQAIRAEGIACELALGDKSAGQHFQNAQKRGIHYGIVADEKLTLRTFETRAQQEVTPSGLAAFFSKLPA